MDARKFKSPPVTSRPAPFWSWNDDMTKEELTRQIDEMSKKGWGNYFMHSRVGLVTPYLSKKWMDLINACCEEANKTGTMASLYDEDKWPSGFAGGLISADERYRERSLFLIKDEDISENDTVLARYQDYNICRHVAPLGMAWFNGYCYVDLLNPETVKAFLECTHDAYAKNCGEYFGNAIPAIFTDEPCYLFSRKSTAKSGGIIPSLPWTDGFPDFFYSKKGYKIEENLAALFFELPNYKKIRYDFFDCATKRFLESFTKPYAEWCEKHNLKMTGHFMAEDSLWYQTDWIGAAMPHYEYMQWPGIDKLGRNLDQLTTVKQLTSVSEQLGKERNLSEVFGCMGQQCSFFHRKWIAEWQAVLGLNFVNHHLSLYSMRGERKRDFPANLFYQQPWWQEEVGFSDYIARVCEYEATTKRDVDILFIHPISSAWCVYDSVSARKTPDDWFAKDQQGDMQLYDDSFKQLSDALVASKLDFHYGDEIIMENNASVDGGKIKVGQHIYSTVVMPASLNLRSNTVELLNAFAKAGGKIICTAPDASMVDGEIATISFMDSASHYANISETVKALSQIYSGRISITNTATGKNADSVFAEHKFADDGEYYYIVSTLEQKSITVDITFAADNAPLLCDFASGDMYSLPAGVKDGRASLNVKLYPAGSLLIKIPNTAQSCPAAPEFIGTGAELGNLDVLESVVFDSAQILDENTLVLNDATLYLDGTLIAKNQPVSTYWHEHFYPAPDGTAFRAEYTFDVASMPNGDITAAIEMAHNLEKILFNGKECIIPQKNLSFDDSCYKDVNFRKISLGKPVVGKNTLTIVGKKLNNITGPNCHIAVSDAENHAATEVEAVYILGDFMVSTPDNISFAITTPKAVCANNITDNGYPFYAGSISLKGNFKCESDIPKFLQLGNVNAACARVLVNGIDCGITYWGPFAYDISKAVKPGGNTVEVTATTTLFNMMGPNRVNNVDSNIFVAPETFVNKEIFTPEYTLLPFGVGGATLLK